MSKMSLFAALALLAAANSVDARVKKVVMVKYDTESGWSKGFCRSVDFFAGSEIDYFAAQKAGISSFKNYAAVWFSEEQVALVKLSGFTWIGEAGPSSILIVSPWTGEDQDGRRWQFSSPVLSCPGQQN
jgi:hypothetical protein